MKKWSYEVGDSFIYIYIFKFLRKLAFSRKALSEFSSDETQTGLTGIPAMFRALGPLHNTKPWASFDINKTCLFRNVDI